MMSNFVVEYRLAVYATYNALFVAWANIAISKYFGNNKFCLFDYKEEYDAWLPSFSFFIICLGFFVDFLYQL